VPILSPGVLDVGFAHVAAHLSGGWGTDGMATDADGNVYIAHYMGGEVVVLDPSGFIVGTIPLPDGAGAQTTNVAFNDGYLYITEAGKNEVWRVEMLAENPAGAERGLQTAYEALEAAGIRVAGSPTELPRLLRDAGYRG